MAPPNTTFAITRCTLIGIQVALAMACHSLMVVGSVVGVMSRGGDIIYVSHAFAMNITVVPHTFSRMPRDRKSTRLNSSHLVISYAVFCLKKKKRVKRQYRN